MKKLYLELLSALAMRQTACKKAISLVILAFTLSSMSYSVKAQVVISPAGGGTAICSSTAIGGTAPACTPIGPITITETLNSDFAIGSDQIILNPPAGWQFCTVPAPVITHLPGDITGIATVFTAGSLTLNITSTGTVAHDAITITGLSVQALSPLAVPGFIYASASSGVSGIVIGTGAGASDFGDLALMPTTITGPPSVCIGSCITLTSGPAGGVWSTTTPGIASVVGAGATATVCGISAGSASIKYTVGGCSETISIPVYPNPAPITVPPLFNYHMCAWYDTISISDGAYAGVFGLYSTGFTVGAGLTVDNFVGTGTGKVHAHAPGVDTIFYTFYTGCATHIIVTVDPLPAPIMSPPYQVCQGSCITLTDASAPGTWASVNPAIGSINAATGVFCGIAPGITLVEYTIPGGFGAGCITDTTMTVLPLPAAIVGLAEICSLQTTTLSDPTHGGAWSSTAAPITPIGPLDTSAVVAGVPAGTTLVSYTLPDGCASTVTVTIDPLPDSIAGPDSVCQGDSILLTDPTPFGKWISGSPLIASVDSLTGYVKGIMGGVATISYSIIPGNCVATYLVTVHSLPGPITASPGDSVCVGGNLFLTDPTGGGTWSNTVIPPITIIDPTGTLTGLGSGVDTIWYTLSTGCRTSILITINALPPPIVGPSSFCLVDSALYTDINLTGGSWNITPSGILSITASYPDSIRVLTVSAGVATITYTNPSGCLVSKSVTVNATPTAIFPATSVCQGDTVTLHDSLILGIWVSSNDSIATIDSFSGLVHGINAGSVIITYIGPGGCYILAPFTVFPSSPISGTTHQVCQGDSIMLTDIWASGFWTSSNNAIATVSGTGTSGGDTAFVVGHLPGVDTISYNLGGCVQTYVVTVNPVSPIAIFGSPQICVHDSRTLFDPVPGGHLWQSQSSYCHRFKYCLTWFRNCYRGRSWSNYDHLFSAYRLQYVYTSNS